ncbi:MAG: helix-turn-helix transcriptional regulator [Mailhella sp.]|nr:helix-turn-helix transcriptional regulator [Mailhella sp.]
MRFHEFFEYHRKLYRLLRSQDKNFLSFKGRLHVYILALSTVLLGCTFFLLSLLGALPSEKDGIAAQLDVLLEDYDRRIASSFSKLAGHGILLSQRLSAALEQELEDRNASMADLSDDPKLIEALEERSYGILEQTLGLASCSGVFVVFDATVNTSIPDSELSRAGVYLKIANINNCDPIAPILLFARGMHEVGSRHKHDFHNRWELEFSLRRLDMFDTLKKNAVPDLKSCFFFSPRINFAGTWENMIMLGVPLMSRKGEFMGICGLEINSLYFRLIFPLESPSSLPVTGLLVCREGELLAPSKGLNSGAYADNFSESFSESLHTERKGALNRYISPQECFVGLEHEIRLSPLDDANRWVVALLVPESAHIFSIHMKYMKMAVFGAVFLVLSYLLSYLISRRFINPILERIDSITAGKAERTEIPEIDDLIEYLSRSDASAPAQEAQADMTEYHAFLSNIETLSKAERAVFNLYMKGLSAQEIADHLHLSIHTVKSHNRRIYTKLNVSSRKELLIFINMMGPAERSQQS